MLPGSPSCTRTWCVVPSSTKGIVTGTPGSGSPSNSACTTPWLTPLGFRVAGRYELVSSSREFSCKLAELHIRMYAAFPQRPSHYTHIDHNEKHSNESKSLPVARRITDVRVGSSRGIGADSRTAGNPEYRSPRRCSGPGGHEVAEDSR